MTAISFILDASRYGHLEILQLYKQGYLTRVEGKKKREN